MSLSHTATICLAAVAAPDQPIGVDLEDIGRVRHADLIVQTLGPDELVLVEGLQGAALAERVARLWCAKEAASKCLGVGLQGNPQAYRVVSADPGCERVTVHHEFGGVETRLVRREHSIIALATQGSWAAQEPIEMEEEG